MNRAGVAIGNGVKLAVGVLPVATVARFPGTNSALVRAYFTPRTPWG